MELCDWGLEHSRQIGTSSTMGGRQGTLSLRLGVPGLLLGVGEWAEMEGMGARGG